MDFIILPLFDVLGVLLNALFYVIIAQTILSWLFAFGIVNTYNNFVNTVADILHRITDPLLRPIRRKIPNFGGIDFSPFILLLVILFLQRMLTVGYMKMAMGPLKTIAF
jgi:YggT family protein